MSISTELNRIRSNIASAYQAVVTMGGTLPATQDATHLPEAIGTLGHIAPEGYTLLDSIYGVGSNSYINTGVKGGSKMGYEIRIKITTFTRSWARYFGDNDLPAWPCLWGGNSAAGSGTLEAGINGGTTFNTLPTGDTWHILKVKDNKFYIDGIEKMTFTNSGWDADKEFRLFTTSWTAGGAGCYIDYCKLYTDDVLVRDYISVKDGDDVAGMYDKTNKLFYPSSTSTPFTAGSEIPSIVIPEPSIKSGSISQQIGRLSDQISKSYSVCNQLGKPMPSIMNSANLADTILGKKEVDYLRFIALADTDITFTKHGSANPSLKYAVNGGEWSNYTLGNSIHLNSGDICYWKGNNSSFSTSTSNYVSFTSTGKVSGLGNIMTLVDETGELLEIPNNYCFHRLFYNVYNLTTSPELPATTLKDHCYYYMFYYCTGLTSAPELPAMNLAPSCYSNMFYYCNKLETPPTVLPATTAASYCYQAMFRECRKLLTPPRIELTSLGNLSNNNVCQEMFNYCTSLKDLPDLKATGIGDGSYYAMFQNCSNIKLSTTKTGKYTKPFRIPTSGTATGYGDYGGCQYMFTSTGGTFASTPRVNTTYYLWVE